MTFPTLLSQIGSYVILAAVFLLMISALVAAHELGHYLFARLFGMGVEEFSIGFGRKRLFTWMQRTYDVKDERAEPGLTETTDFTVRPWPLGGFVRIKGMVPEDDGSEVDIQGGFYSKPPWQRFIVLLAGPAFSVLFGILVLVPLYMSIGVKMRDNSPVIPAVYEATPAAKAGLQGGDRLVSINGQPATTFYDYLSTVRKSAGVPINLVIERKGVEMTKTVTPELNEDDSLVLGPDLEPTGEWAQQAITGVAPPDFARRERLGFSAAVQRAVGEPVRVVRGLANLVARPKNFDKTVSGPVTIVKYTELALKEGFDTVVQLAALLSISIGIFNLFPIGMLDGGQMLVAVVEMFRRGRRLSVEAQNAFTGAGFLFIVVLMVTVLFVDVKRWFLPSAPPAVKAETTRN